MARDYIGESFASLSSSQKRVVMSMADRTGTYSGEGSPETSAFKPYSLGRALQSIFEHDESIAPFERQISSVLAGREPSPRVQSGIGGGLLIPVSLQRDLAVSGSATNLVGTMIGRPLIPLIEALREASVADALGVQMISGLRENAVVAKIANAATTNWIGSELATSTPGEPVFAGIASEPRTINAYIKVSRKVFKQAADVIDSFVLPELGLALGTAIDKALINGAGSSGEPLGIMGTNDIDTDTAASIAWDDIVAMIGAVGNANAVRRPGATGFAFGTDVESLLLSRERFAGAGEILHDGTIAGRPAVASNSVPSGSMVYGDWSSVMILQWGSLLLQIDPRTNAAGTHTVSASILCDILVRHPESFSVRTSIT